MEREPEVDVASRPEEDSESDEEDEELERLRERINEKHEASEERDDASVGGEESQEGEGGNANSSEEPQSTDAGEDEEGATNENERVSGGETDPRESTEGQRSAEQELGDEASDPALEGKGEAERGDEELERPTDLTDEKEESSDTADDSAEDDRESEGPDASSAISPDPEPRQEGEPPDQVDQSEKKEREHSLDAPDEREQGRSHAVTSAEEPSERNGQMHESIATEIEEEHASDEGEQREAGSKQGAISETDIIPSGEEQDAPLNVERQTGVDVFRSDGSLETEEDVTESSLEPTREQLISIEQQEGTQVTPNDNFKHNDAVDIETSVSSEAAVLKEEEAAVSQNREEPVNALEAVQQVTLGADNLSDGLETSHVSSEAVEAKVEIGVEAPREDRADLETIGDTVDNNSHHEVILDEQQSPTPQHQDGSAHDLYKRGELAGHGQQREQDPDESQGDSIRREKQTLGELIESVPGDSQTEFERHPPEPRVGGQDDESIFDLKRTESRPRENSEVEGVSQPNLNRDFAIKSPEGERLGARPTYELRGHDDVESGRSSRQEKITLAIQDQVDQESLAIARERQKIMLAASIVSSHSITRAEAEKVPSSSVQGLGPNGDSSRRKSDSKEGVEHFSLNPTERYNRPSPAPSTSLEKSDTTAGKDGRILESPKSAVAPERGGDAWQDRLPKHVPDHELTAQASRNYGALDRRIDQDSTVAKAKDVSGQKRTRFDNNLTVDSQSGGEKAVIRKFLQPSQDSAKESLGKATEKPLTVITVNAHSLSGRENGVHFKVWEPIVEKQTGVTLERGKLYEISGRIDGNFDFKTKHKVGENRMFAVYPSREHSNSIKDGERHTLFIDSITEKKQVHVILGPEQVIRGLGTMEATGHELQGRKVIRFTLSESTFADRTGIHMQPGKLYDIRGVVGNGAEFQLTHTPTDTPQLNIIIGRDNAASIRPGEKHQITLTSVEEKQVFQVSGEPKVALHFSKRVVELAGVETRELASSRVVEFELKKLGAEKSERMFGEVMPSIEHVSLNAKARGFKPGDEFQLLSARNFSARDFVDDYNRFKLGKLAITELKLHNTKLLLTVDSREFAARSFSIGTWSTEVVMRANFDPIRRDVRFWFDGERITPKFGRSWNIHSIKANKDGFNVIYEPGSRPITATKFTAPIENEWRLKRIDRHIIETNLSLLSSPTGREGQYDFQVRPYLANAIRFKLEAAASREAQNDAKGAIGEELGVCLLEMNQWKELVRHPGVLRPTTQGANTRGPDSLMLDMRSQEKQLFEFKWWRNVSGAQREALRQMQEAFKEDSSRYRDVKGGYIGIIHWNARRNLGSMNVEMAWRRE